MIYGDKIVLGPVERKHLPQMVEYRNDPELQKYFREYRLLTLEMQTKWWEDKVVNDLSCEYFVIYTRGTEGGDYIIGMTGLTYMHPVNRNGEVAIVIGNEDCRGKGLGQDVLKTLVRHGFLKLNLRRIDAEVYANNLSSVALFDKVGFQKEGVLRDRYYCDGKFWDSIMFSMLRNEFDQFYWATESFT